MAVDEYRHAPRNAWVVVGLVGRIWSVSGAGEAGEAGGAGEAGEAGGGGSGHRVREMGSSTYLNCP